MIEALLYSVDLRYVDLVEIVILEISNTNRPGHEQCQWRDIYDYYLDLARSSQMSINYKHHSPITHSFFKSSTDRP